MLEGGFGSAVLECAAEMDADVSITVMAVEDRFIQHGDHKHLLLETGLDDAAIAQKMKRIVQEGKDELNG